MYESITYESILRRMITRSLEREPNIDTREGSILYNALAPAAMELQNLYLQLDAVLNQTFADTAMGEYLERRAAERGLVPYAATRAVLKGVFNMDIPIGSRFSLDELNYIAVERLGEGVYYMACETEGEAGNTKLGTIIPIQYINGLTDARLTELLIPGEEREDTESLRKRYFLSLHAQAFGGNIADYREKIVSLDGVGSCKVYPVWNGGGTVKVVFLDSQFAPPSDVLVESVQQAVDPDTGKGAGYGFAPIGHVVTVKGAQPLPIDVSAAFTYQEGWDWAQVRTDAEQAVAQYFLELTREWAAQEQLTVRISQLETRFLALSGVIDVADTTLNGQRRNVVLHSEQIPVRGVVVG